MLVHSFPRLLPFAPRAQVIQGQERVLVREQVLDRFSFPCEPAI
jgi:hypothetical protein